MAFKKLDFTLYFLKCDLAIVGPKICVSFGGSMPIAQIKRCHLTPSPTKGTKILLEYDIYFSKVTRRTYL